MPGPPRTPPRPPIRAVALACNSKPRSLHFDCVRDLEDVRTHSRSTAHAMYTRDTETSPPVPHVADVPRLRGPRVACGSRADIFHHDQLLTNDKSLLAHNGMAHNCMALETSTQSTPCQSRLSHPARGASRDSHSAAAFHAQLQQHTRPACLALLAWGTLTRLLGSSPSSPRRASARRAQPA